MTVYMRTSEVIGLPVVTVSGGEDVAEVRDVVYAPDEGSLLGFTLNKRGFLRGRMKAALAASSVRAIGTAAVMIDDESTLSTPSDAPEEVARPPAGRNVLGNAVITEGGVRLGAVSDLVLAVGGRGMIVGYELRRDDAKEPWYVPRPAQLAVSGDVLLVPDRFEEYVSRDLSGFALAIDRLGQHVR